MKPKKNSTVNSNDSKVWSQLYNGFDGLKDGELFIDNIGSNAVYPYIGIKQAEAVTVYGSTKTKEQLYNSIFTLPEDYIQLDYIYGTNCYFKTDYYGTEKSKYVFDIMPETQPSAWGGVMSVGRYNYHYGMSFSQHENQTYFNINWNDNVIDTLYAYTFNTKYHVEYSVTDISITPEGGTAFTSTNSNSWNGYSTVPLAIGRCWNSDTSSWQDTAFCGRIYGFKVYEDGTLVRNFVPCINNRDVVGMYDTVNKVFYASVSTAFSQGNMVTPMYVLPEGYTEVEYVYSAGDVYVPTNYYHNNNTQIFLKINIQERHSGVGAIYGCDGWQGRCSWYYGYSFRRLDFGNTCSSNSAYSMSFGTHLLYQNTNKFYLDGSLIYTNSYSGTFQAVDPVQLWLFTAYTETPNGYYHSAYKMYHCRIYENDELKCQFIPCINPDGVAGLYDTVRDTFFTVGPLLTTTLTAGDPVVYTDPINV